MPVIRGSNRRAFFIRRLTAELTVVLFLYERYTREITVQLFLYAD